MTSTPAPSTPPHGTPTVDPVTGYALERTYWYDTPPVGTGMTRAHGVWDALPVETSGYQTPGLTRAKVDEIVAADETSYRLQVSMSKIQCAWCSAPALHAVTDLTWGDTYHVCDAHRDEWFPRAQVPTVSLIKPGVPVHGTRPTEADLRNRRQSGPPNWAYGPTFLTALADNECETLAVAFEITANLRRSL